MDQNTTIIVVAVVALFAVIIIAFLLRFRGSAKAEITGPVSLGFKMEASNPPPPTVAVTPTPPASVVTAPPPMPGVSVVNAKSSSGGIVAEDHTGRGARVEGVDVKDDILVSSSPASGEVGPKA